MQSLFSKRSSGEEIMDDLGCSGQVVAQTLRELNIINKLLGGNLVTLKGIEQLLASHTGPQEISIADLGCGSGDILKVVATWARRKNINLHLHGIDANPFIVDFARINTPEGSGIEYHTVNVLSKEFRHRKFDIVLATLFMHHLTDDQLVGLLGTLMEQVRIGIVINDIHRHPLAYYSIRFLTRALSESSMVKYDAPLSVLRAFSRKDLESILARARISNYSLKWKWAFRWQLVIRSR